jgi:hypothetical protein
MLTADGLSVSNPGSPQPIFFGGADGGQVTKLAIGGCRSCCRTAAARPAPPVPALECTPCLDLPSLLCGMQSPARALHPQAT